MNITSLGNSNLTRTPQNQRKELDNIMAMEITTIVEEELLPDINVLVGVDADPVVARHHQDLHLAVGLAAVVRKSDLTTHPGQDDIRSVV